MHSLHFSYVWWSASDFVVMHMKCHNLQQTSFSLNNAFLFLFFFFGGGGKGVKMTDRAPLYCSLFCERIQSGCKIEVGDEENQHWWMTILKWRSISHIRAINMYKIKVKTFINHNTGGKIKLINCNAFDVRNSTISSLCFHPSLRSPNNWLIGVSAVMWIKDKFFSEHAEINLAYLLCFHE